MKILFFLIDLLFFPTISGYTEIVTTYNEKSLIVNEQIIIMDDISNSQEIEQNFVYLIQIKNKDDMIISLSWLTGFLSLHKSFSPAHHGFLQKLEYFIFKFLYGQV